MLRFSFFKIKRKGIFNSFINTFPCIENQLKICNKDENFFSNNSKDEKFNANSQKSFSLRKIFEHL